MINYLLKKKIEKDVEEQGKKAMVYAGIALAGLGAYCVYKAVKNSRMNFEEEKLKYLNNKSYDEDEYAELFDQAIEEEEEKQDAKQKELEKKVEEFNSRRISFENCPHVSQEEMQDFLDKIKDDKSDVKVNPEDYKEEDFENYEYYDDILTDKK